ERRRVPGLDPERAPVIVAGAVVLVEILRRYGLDEIEVSEHDLLHGVALAPGGVHLLLRTSGGGSSSARRRCTADLDRTPTRRLPSVTGARSASASSSSR